jgi:quercetin dioxygenase-like cupin family protein
MADAVIRQDGEGERLWFAGGGVLTVKAAADETGGAFFLFEDHVERGKTTPLHVHPHEDELIYVLEGEVLAHVDGDEHRVGERGFFFAPRGVPHAFLVTSETARLLAWLTPGTGERLFREAGEPVTSEDDVSRPPDFDRLRAVAESTGCLQILGPPPFEQATLAPR